ncbi:DUF5684 domain-containing protein [Pedobacter sp. SL55]|uniref:DUF5684 domain-containing protein n=1 Tax=Pedobacter sp. SL55 TaxID=2995161 RepID=UPI0022722339|nr:DUF5684 domain-containing protein [Pedobacter sp. SL55]WAC41512.1 DUF5684 domain-containing protein [Pedobacter sp. SL55]
MDYSSDYSSEGAGILAGLGIGFFIFFFGFFILMIASMWKTFEKAGQPGWACLIPIYSTYIMIKIVGKPDIWLLWCLIPCVNFVFGIWLTNLISKSFGKDEGFTVGLILLSFIFWPILGFGSAKYLGPSAAEAQQGRFGNGFGNPNDPFNQQNPNQF